MTRSSNLKTWLVALVTTTLLAACANGGAADPVVSTAAPQSSSAPMTVDYSCNGDAQCVIKDIGSCCGYRPACVNVDSPTDPAAVKAACAGDGRSGICGFPAISSCQCVNHRCEGITGFNTVDSPPGDK